MVFSIIGNGLFNEGAREITLNCLVPRGKVTHLCRILAKGLSPTMSYHYQTIFNPDHFN